MPQSGTGVSVEAVDYVYQTTMMDRLKQTGRPEMIVGWYHSHPGFGCWLSSVDINTQQVSLFIWGEQQTASHIACLGKLTICIVDLYQSFERLHPRCVAVVVDPIQSVKGKVVIDAFRLINPQGISEFDSVAHRSARACWLIQLSVLDNSQ